MKLTKDQFKEALLSDGILKGRNLEMLSLIFNAPNCHATDLQLAEVLGYTDTAPINALINKLGKRIALYHNLTPEKLDISDGSQWCQLITDCRNDEKGFPWSVQPNLSDALVELRLLQELEPQHLTIDDSH